MNTLYKLTLTISALFLLSADIFSQVDSTWTVRTDFITPAGQADSSLVKEVYVVVNLPLFPSVRYIKTQIGTTEGASDLFNAEINIHNLSVTPSATINQQGMLVIPCGIYTIDPVHFYTGILLFDPHMLPLN